MPLYYIIYQIEDIYVIVKCLLLTSYIFHLRVIIYDEERERREKDMKTKNAKMKNN